jgi:hypothetical protein
MKRFILFIMALMPILFVACNNEMAISPKNVSAVDFLELYDKDADYIRKSLAKYKLDEEGIDEDGNNYWTIRKSKSSVLIPCDSYDVFVSLTMKNNKCVEVSLLYQDTYYSGSALQGITNRFGEGRKIDYDSNYKWYEWHLSDNSHISYFGQKKLFSESLLIYRECEDAPKAPAKKLQQARRIAGVE